MSVYRLNAHILEANHTKWMTIKGRNDNECKCQLCYSETIFSHIIEYMYQNATLKLRFNNTTKKADTIEHFLFQSGWQAVQIMLKIEALGRVLREPASGTLKTPSNLLWRCKLEPNPFYVRIVRCSYSNSQNMTDAVYININKQRNNKSLCNIFLK